MGVELNEIGPGMFGTVDFGQIFLNIPVSESETMPETRVVDRN